VQKKNVSVPTPIIIESDAQNETLVGGPILVDHMLDYSYETIEVTNGYHRYYASVAVSYKYLPVVFWKPYEFEEI